MARDIGCDKFEKACEKENIAELLSGNKTIFMPLDAAFDDYRSEVRADFLNFLQFFKFNCKFWYLVSKFSAGILGQFRTDERSGRRRGQTGDFETSSSPQPYRPRRLRYVRYRERN
ncbi:unnamed protein product, partial [Nesidiocoris tenuis]